MLVCQERQSTVTKPRGFDVKGNRDILVRFLVEVANVHCAVEGQ